MRSVMRPGAKELAREDDTSYGAGEDLAVKDSPSGGTKHSKRGQEWYESGNAETNCRDRPSPSYALVWLVEVRLQCKFQ